MVGAIAAVTMVVAGYIMLSADRLSSLVATSGLASLRPAAVSPFGPIAYALLAVVGGLPCAAAGWLLLTPARSVRARASRIADDARDGVPIVRRADSHPDAPPRAPIRAGRDLGAPFLSVTAPAADGSPPPDAPAAPGRAAIRVSSSSRERIDGGELDAEVCDSPEVPRAGFAKPRADPAPPVAERRSAGRTDRRKTHRRRSAG